MLQSRVIQEHGARSYPSAVPCSGHVKESCAWVFEQHLDNLSIMTERVAKIDTRYLKPATLVTSAMDHGHMERNGAEQALNTPADSEIMLPAETDDVEMRTATLLHQDSSCKIPH